MTYYFLIRFGILSHQVYNVCFSHLFVNYFNKNSFFLLGKEYFPPSPKMEIDNVKC